METYEQRPEERPLLRVMEKIKKKKRKNLEESLNTIIRKICILVEKPFGENRKSKFI